MTMIPEFGVTDRPLLVLYAGLFVLAHVLLVAFMYARSNTDSVDSSGGLEPDGDRMTSESEQETDLSGIDTESPVTCPNCGVDNDPDYRFCRHCVGELHSGVSIDSATSGQQQQRPF